MFSKKSCLYSGRSLFLSGMIALFLESAASSMYEFPADHPALALFPSPQEWRSRIESAKEDQPDSFEAVRADFHLAITSTYLLENSRPKLAEELALLPKRTLEPKQRGPRFWVKEQLLYSMEEFASKEGGRELVDWYREHMDELTVDDSPMLRVVLADAILNDWSDWTAWEQSERLKDLRIECPQPYRRFAWDLAVYYSILDYNGISLRALVESNRIECFNYEFSVRLVRASRHPQVLDYLVQASKLPLPNDRRWMLLTAADSLQPNDDLDQTKAFRDVWEQELDTQDRDLRAIAVTRCGEMVRRIRIHTKGRDNGDALQTRLEQIAQSDTDPEVSRRAGEILQSIRTAEWREEP